MSTARGGASGHHRDYCYREAVPFAAMVALQCIGVGLNTLYKVAANDGMSRHVFLVYAYAVAAVLLLPSPFFSRRSRGLPPLNLSILLKILLLGGVGYAAVITGFTGISYTSPTLASAISNLSPAFTFILAIIFSAKMGLSIDNKILFSCLIILCATPLSLCSRVLHEKSVNSESLFHELGFDASVQELLHKNDLVSSFSEAPGGPDPHHLLSVPVGSLFREAPGGPDPHHLLSVPVGSLFREAPGGPDPHHLLSVPVGSLFREAPGGPDPYHHLSVPVGSLFREAPGGPDPHHHLSVPVGSLFREAPGGPDPYHHLSVPVGSLFKGAPGGPDPHHHFSVPEIPV